MLASHSSPRGCQSSASGRLWCIYVSMGPFVQVSQTGARRSYVPSLGTPARVNKLPPHFTVSMSQGSIPVFLIIPTSTGPASLAVITLSEIILNLKPSHSDTRLLPRSQRLVSLHRLLLALLLTLLYRLGAPAVRMYRRLHASLMLPLWRRTLAPLAQLAWFFVASASPGFRAPTDVHDSMRS